MDTRVAVITGARSGIGAACAEVLAGKGHHIIVADRDMTGAEQVVSALVAFAVGFLTSEHAGYITGHTPPVDGGFVAAGLLNI